MKLTHIITLANQAVRDPFLALEASLRAVGCTLPLYVIPYNNQKFELPENSHWLDDPALFDLLAQHNAHPMMRKYACLTRQDYLFVDTDVVFLKNPVDYFEPFNGFVASCTHWSNPGHTTSPQSLATFRAQTTTWPRFVFNAGQFACSQSVYANFDALKAACLTQPETTLAFPYHDQPGLNYLVRHSGVPFTNITLPPYAFESSWAGDYLNCATVEPTDRSPCFLHWAGLHITGASPIDALFLNHLPDDRREAFVMDEKAKLPTFGSRMASFLRRVKATFLESFR